MNAASYRPRNPGHDYYGRGIYLVTLVVSGREALFGRLNNDVRHPQSGLPYEETADYARQRGQWIAAVMGGATVIVTPGISRGELTMKNECLEKGYPLIHLQKEPIHSYWKPEKRRFEACAKGQLLILAPWALDDMEEVNGVPADSDYSRFHHLNKIAADICAFNGDAKIVKITGKIAQNQ